MKTGLSVEYYFLDQRFLRLFDCAQFFLNHDPPMINKYISLNLQRIYYDTFFFNERV